MCSDPNPRIAEARKAAQVGGTLHLDQLLTRLLAESGDPHSMFDACADVLAAVRVDVAAIAVPVVGEARRSLDVGHMVTATAPWAWAGRTGLVVYIEPVNAAHPFCVDFRESGIGVGVFSAEQVRRVDWR